jgi:hypothetical protein
VEEDRVAVREVVDDVDALLVGNLDQVVIADEDRVARIGDVEDVGVVELGVVHDHGVGLLAVLPDEDRVGAVRDRGRVLVLGRVIG